MSDAALLALADAAGVAAQWRDAFGHTRTVAPDTLRHVLAALELPAHTDGDIHDSLARLRATAALPPLLTLDAGQKVPLELPGRARLTLESGEAADVTAQTVLDQPGYHRLEFGDQEVTLAVAPPRCHGIRDRAAAGRLWGIAAQLYALRRQGDGGIGDFAALSAFVVQAAKAGADAVAVSPIHAQFSADPDRFSPYSPSSRSALNVLHADTDGLLPPDPAAPGFEALSLIDWPRAGRAKLARLRAVYAAQNFGQNLSHGPSQNPSQDPSQNPSQNPALAAAFAAWRTDQGPALERHARFEALHAHFFGGDDPKWHWRDWPAAYRTPDRPEVAAFARDHAAEVGFHAFAQFLADRGLRAAQAAARDAGMKIGLISDLAVGADGGGAQAWSAQAETLLGLSIGAPPDILSTAGQDWGLAAFSPLGLIRHGFSSYLEMLRVALRHAGGVRIDHVMALARLWVLPEGASPAQGAYLRYPLADLLRLVALESQRHQAVILGEDLGTVPEGFSEQLADRLLLGLRVLWFEMDADAFRPPRRWTRDAAAMTSTHDLATVAGWWTGRDLDLRRPLGLLGDEAGIWHAYENRARERGRLWQAFADAGSTHAPQPPPEQPAPAVDAAVRHVGGSACDFAILPIEDALGTVEQPNLPGTTDQHPNWRRRLPADAATLFATEDVTARLAAMNAARRA